MCLISSGWVDKPPQACMEISVSSWITTHPPLSHSCFSLSSIVWGDFTVLRCKYSNNKFTPIYNSLYWFRGFAALSFDKQIASQKSQRDSGLNSTLLSARRRGQEPWPHFLWWLHKPCIVCENVTGLLGLLHIWQLFWPPPSLSTTTRKIYVCSWYSPQELPQNNSTGLNFVFTPLCISHMLWIWSATVWFSPSGFTRRSSVLMWFMPTSFASASPFRGQTLVVIMSSSYQRRTSLLFWIIFIAIFPSVFHVLSREHLFRFLWNATFVSLSFSLDACVLGRCSERMMLILDCLMWANSLQASCLKFEYERCISSVI